MLNYLSILYDIIPLQNLKPNSYRLTYFLFTRSRAPAHNFTQSHVYPSGPISRPGFFLPGLPRTWGGGLVSASYIHPSNQVISNKGLVATLLSLHYNLHQIDSGMLLNILYFSRILFCSYYLKLLIYA